MSYAYRQNRKAWRKDGRWTTLQAGAEAWAQGCEEALDALLLEATGGNQEDADLLGEAIRQHEETA